MRVFFLFNKKHLLQASLAALCLSIMHLSYANASISDDYQQTVLAIHNKYRALHHAPKLAWDDELAQFAQRYANKCVFQHSGSPYGENLAAGYASAGAAVKAWYEEHVNYSYRRPGFSHDTGHFTQVVWKSTTKIGCGLAVCDGKNGTPGSYLVCEYTPHGNVTNAGYFEANVLRQ